MGFANQVLQAPRDNDCSTSPMMFTDKGLPYSQVVHARGDADLLKQSHITGHNETAGLLGRGYVILVLFAAVTDAMTLAGWAATSEMWQYRLASLVCLWMVRMCGLWGLSLSLICYMLEEQDQMQQQSLSVWHQALQWWVLE